MSDRPSSDSAGAPKKDGEANDERPRGRPTDDRHTTETGGGQIDHDEPHTTGHPAKGPRNPG